MVPVQSKLFPKCVSCILRTWSALELAVEHELGGPHTKEKASWMEEVMVQFFSENGKVSLIIIWSPPRSVRDRAEHSQYHLNIELNLSKFVVHLSGSPSFAVQMAGGSPSNPHWYILTMAFIWRIWESHPIPPSILLHLLEIIHRVRN